MLSFDCDNERNVFPTWNCVSFDESPYYLNIRFPDDLNIGIIVCFDNVFYRNGAFSLLI